MRDGNQADVTNFTDNDFTHRNRHYPTQRVALARQAVQLINSGMRQPSIGATTDMSALGRFLITKTRARYTPSNSNLRTCW